MCHHLKSIDELSPEEREEVREKHSVEELRTEYSAEDLEKLDVTA